MIDELKFRILDIDAQKILPVDVIEWENGVIKWIKSGDHMYSLSRVILMQFITKDVDDKDIYENDLVEATRIEDGKIITVQVGIGTIFIDYLQKPFRLLGNKWENPELLSAPVTGYKTPN